MTDHPSPPPPPTLHELYPQLREDELRQTEENLERYLALVLRIFERVRNDPEAYARLRTLTAQEGYVTMRDEGSKLPIIN